jgi:hypothetical protein
MSVRTADFRRDYAPAFAEYRIDGGEAALRAAYELGRRAVGEGLSVLDLAAAHHDALLAALAEQTTLAEAERVAAAAGDFFLESLSAFEMVQRGFHEARETALVEQRQTAMLRQLSSFLADASLALDVPDALEEVVQLVAEQARELVGAECCLTSVAVEDHRVPLVALARSDSADGPPPDVRPESLLRLSSLLSAPADALRLTAAELTADPMSRAFSQLLGTTGPIRGRLIAPLTALDGSDLGSIQLFDKQGGDFTEIDEAVLVHLAETASAAIERAQLHELARRLTAATLPAALPELPEVELAARSLGAKRPRVWYDVAPLRDGCAGIGIGEFDARGFAVALAAERARTAVRACAPCAQPEAIVAAVDAAVRELEPRLSSTALYAVVDAARQQASIASIGHPPPLLVADGDVRAADGGIVHIDAAATLVVYGGMPAERVRALVERGGSEPAAICDAVASAQATDDFAVIALRCRA